MSASPPPPGEPVPIPLTFSLFDAARHTTPPAQNPVLFFLPLVVACMRFAVLGIVMGCLRFTFM
jgi:hypothetical protein